MGYPANNNPGQQGSSYGQYGSQAKGPAMSPYNMNNNTYDNNRINDYNHTMSNPNPSLPVNIQPGPDKTWYPGIYPSTQPQFGTNPYSPQTANVSGHPGHNPSTLPAVEPNQSNTAYSNHGQFVQGMASGGSSFSGPAKKWAGPVHTNTTKPENVATQIFSNIFGGVKGPGNQFPGHTYNESGGYYTNEKGQKFTAVPNPAPAPSSSYNVLGSFGTTMGGIGNMPNYNPNPWAPWAHGSSYNPYILEPMPTPSFKPPVPKLTNVYKPQYAPAPVMSNMDSWGNPLY